MEKQISFVSRGKKIFGFLHLPDRMHNSPCVVYCHGFTGDHIGANRMNLLFSRAAAAEGIAVLRFDFAGSGDSEGAFEEETYLTGWIEDFNNAVTFVKGYPGVDKDNISYVGLSFGGSTILYAENLLAQARSIVLWSAVTRLVDSFKWRVIGEEKWGKMQSGETIQGFYAKNLRLNPSFAEDLGKYPDIKEMCDQLTMPVLNVHADLDAVVPIEDSLALHRLISERNSHSTFVTIKGDDHLFTQRITEVIDLTVRWLKTTFYQKS